MKTIAFFNNKGGVGKTSLVYHLAWMYADQGLSVIAADLDPQSNLTSMFLEDDRLEQLWPDDDGSKSVYGAIQPILEGTGDVADPYIEDVADNISLLLGDDAFRYYDPDRGGWRLEPGEFSILVGSSSRDIRLRGQIELQD